MLTTEGAADGATGAVPACEGVGVSVFAAVGVVVETGRGEELMMTDVGDTELTGDGDRAHAADGAREGTAVVG